MSKAKKKPHLKKSKSKNSAKNSKAKTAKLKNKAIKKVSKKKPSKVSRKVANASLVKAKKSTRRLNSTELLDDPFGTITKHSLFKTKFLSIIKDDTTSL